MGQTNRRVEPYTVYHSMLLDSNSGARDDHKFWLYKNINIQLLELVNKYKFWRVHATVACSHMAGCSWIESLGFEFESTLVKYGPSKEDHYMYRKFYEV